MVNPRFRYALQYAHHDGNVYTIGYYQTVARAQQALANPYPYSVTLTYVRHLRLPTFIIDCDNPERGDISDKES